MRKGRHKEIIPVIGVAMAIAVILFAAPGAMAADTVKLQVHNPTGSIQVTEVFAPRLADLNGKTICELANRQWETNRTFPAVTEALQKAFPTVKILDADKMPFFDERSTPDDLAKVAQTVKAAGCQAAIIGNAG